MKIGEKLWCIRKKSKSDRMFSASALFSASNQSNIKKCIFCNQENHKSRQLIVSKPEVRKGIILSKKLCYICLKAGHIAKTCRSNFHCFKCKKRHHVCICTFKNVSGNQNFHDSKNVLEVGFTQTDKQNDDKKKPTVGSQNIASAHLSINLYHVSSVLLQTTQAYVFSCNTKNGKICEYYSTAVLRSPLSVKRHVIN